MSGNDIVLRVVPSLAIFALLVWCWCCRVEPEPSTDLHEEFLRERRAELETKVIIKRVVKACKRKSTLSQRLTEADRAYSSYLSAFLSRSRHGSVRFANVEGHHDETIEEGETQLEEESERKKEEEGIVEASKRKSTLSERSTEVDRAHSSSLSAFSSRSRRSVQFSNVVEDEDKRIEVTETKLKEESEHKREEETAQVEELSAPKQPHGTASERRTQSSRSSLSWIPSFSSAPSDNVSDNVSGGTLQEPRRRRRRRKSNILARAISRSFRHAETCCNICLMEYQVGEEVCLSSNEDCMHVFHKACILDWLLRTRKCPVCRRDYVP
jgi:hypothetical protein